MQEVSKYVLLCQTIKIRSNCIFSFPKATENLCFSPTGGYHRVSVSCRAAAGEEPSHACKTVQWGQWEKKNISLLQILPTCNALLASFISSIFSFDLKNKDNAISNFCQLLPNNFKRCRYLTTFKQSTLNFYLVFHIIAASRRCCPKYYTKRTSSLQRAQNPSNGCRYVWDYMDKRNLYQRSSVQIPKASTWHWYEPGIRISGLSCWENQPSPSNPVPAHSGLSKLQYTQEIFTQGMKAYTGHGKTIQKTYH